MPPCFHGKVFSVNSNEGKAQHPSSKRNSGMLPLFFICVYQLKWMRCENAWKSVFLRTFENYLTLSYAYGKITKIVYQAKMVFNERLRKWNCSISFVSFCHFNSYRIFVFICFHFAKIVYPGTSSTHVSYISEKTDAELLVGKYLIVTGKQNLYLASFFLLCCTLATQL